ncbi:MAG TPA: hypothetical protein DCQ98_20650 [Planctomycetaceae bacterium]|nr:hypothetical protein [Planctomycetaceae bacterium]HRE99703.1 hypothetical protein [Pirellulaceae bacterium]
MTGWLRSTLLADSEAEDVGGIRSDAKSVGRTIERIDAAAAADPAWRALRGTLEQHDPDGIWASDLIDVRRQHLDARAEIERQLAFAMRTAIVVGLLAIGGAVLAYLIASSYLAITFPDAAFLPWQKGREFHRSVLVSTPPPVVRVEIAFGGLFRAALVGGLIPLVLGLIGQMSIVAARRMRSFERGLERLPLFGGLLAETNWLAWADVKNLLVGHGIAPLVAAEASAAAIFGRSWKSSRIRELEIDTATGRIWLPIGAAARESVRTIAPPARTRLETEAWQVDLRRRLSARTSVVTLLALIVSVQTGVAMLTPVFSASVVMIAELAGNRTDGIPSRTGWWSSAGGVIGLIGLFLLTALGSRRFVERTPFDPEHPALTPLHASAFSRRQVHLIAWGLLWVAFAVRWHPAGIGAVLLSLSLPLLADMRRRLNAVETLSIQQRLAIGLDAGARPPRAVLWSVAGYDGWRGYVVARYMKRLKRSEVWYRSLARLRVAAPRYGDRALRLGLGRSLGVAAVEMTFASGVERNRAKERASLKNWGTTFAVMAVALIVIGLWSEIRPTLRQMLRDVGVSTDQRLMVDPPKFAFEPVSIRLYRAFDNSTVRTLALFIPLRGLAIVIATFVVVRLACLVVRGLGQLDHRTVLLRWLALLRSSGRSWQESIETIESIADRRQLRILRHLKRSDPIEAASLGFADPEHPFDAPGKPTIDSPEAWQDAGLMTAREIRRGAISHVDPMLLGQLAELREIRRHRWSMASSAGYRLLIILLVVPPALLIVLQTYLPLLIMLDWSGVALD